MQMQNRDRRRRPASSLVCSLSTIALVSGLAACQPDTETTAPAPRIARVVEADPQPSTQRVEGSGSVEARNTVDVGFLVDGRLQSRAVDIGDEVKVGDVIATIDPTDLQNQLDSANAQVAAAEAELARATPEEAAKRKLLADGVTTQNDYDQALKALQTAKANVDGAKASQRLAQDQLKYATLTSTVDGIVTETGAEPGEVVAAKQMIVQVAEEKSFDGVFSVGADIATAATIGLPVEVWLQSDPTVRMSGTIRQIAPLADPTTGTYTIKVALPDDRPPTVRLGSLVRGSAEVTGDTVVKLPPTALLQTGDNPMVWVVSPSDDTVAKRQVTVLRYDSDAVLVSDGLKKGELVVSIGVNSLTEGQEVKPEKVAGQ
jgi:RND family efflux transporter MFP subunit